MNSKVLLVDFGASRIKCVVWSVTDARSLDTAECSAPSPIRGLKGEVEILAEDYWTALETILYDLLQRHTDLRRLWLCVEMHGILFADIKSNRPISNYISWRDERASKPGQDQQVTLELLQNGIAEKFQKISGMKLRSGLPFVTLAHLHREDALPATFRILTLADWLLLRGGEAEPAIHASLAAGTGFYSIEEQKWSAELFSSISIDIETIVLPKVVNTGKAIGTIKICNRDLQIFGGVGDMQAAAHGIGFPLKSELLLNLGTGSQVLAADKTYADSLELRLSVNNDLFTAITHIPSGRALNVYADFIDECAISGGGTAIFWSQFSSLTTEEVLNAERTVDLNVFEASWQFNNSGGAVTGIQEGNYSLKSMMANLAKSWLMQYVEALSLVDPDHQKNTYLLAGGLAKRAKFVMPVINVLSARQGLPCTSLTGEETLDGLLAMADEA
ncbi:MAG: FGGY family carbohydrate kinase [Gammaproteobacteria bacterium]|nr:FGGY family carbohydrate kinase [Gammaproteobacteria bacterium]